MKKQEKKYEGTLPKLTGVYLFKNIRSEIIYIGKAKNLHVRVNSYFKKYGADWKINQLLDEYTTIEHIVTNTEAESLLLEARLIQQHKPKFNVLLKEGQPFLYIVVTQNSMPTMRLVRNKNIKGLYFGPFLEKYLARKAYAFLQQTFKLILCNKKIENGCLDYHIGTCSGSCKSDFDLSDYRFRLSLAVDVLNNNSAKFVTKIKKEITKHNAAFLFEKAQHLHDYLTNMDAIFNRLKINCDEKQCNTDTKVGVSEQLQALINAQNPIRTIDCFDISHFQSSYIVGSCVRFTDAKPDKRMFRRFIIRSLQEQNDYAALQEIIGRRYKEQSDIPDLIVIDGGKGQLNAAQYIMPNASIVSLAKREEILYGPHFPQGIYIDVTTNAGKTLIALRDYAHHFAISYHRFKRKEAIKIVRGISEYTTGKKSTP